MINISTNIDSFYLPFVKIKCKRLQIPTYGFEDNQPERKRHIVFLETK